jgi:hypothetical protein
MLLSEKISERDEGSRSGLKKTVSIQMQGAEVEINCKNYTTLRQSEGRTTEGPQR